MGINFISLEKTELELKENFLSLIKLCRKMYSRLENMFTTKEINEQYIEKMDSYKFAITESRRDIRDDCIWIISKDQPRAGHLRFIIAILYSIKDIERMSEYAATIAKILHNEKLTITMINQSSDLFLKSIAFFDQIIKLLTTENVENYEEEVNDLFHDFRANYKKFLTFSIKEFSSKKFNKNVVVQVEHYFSFSIVIKYIDRIVDHAHSIYNNFMLIKGNSNN